MHMPMYLGYSFSVPPALLFLSLPFPLRDDMIPVLGFEGHSDRSEEGGGLLDLPRGDPQRESGKESLLRPVYLLDQRPSFLRQRHQVRFPVDRVGPELHQVFCRQRGHVRLDVLAGHRAGPGQLGDRLRAVAMKTPKDPPLPAAYPALPVDSLRCRPHSVEQGNGLPEQGIQRL